jgi:RNA polymerase sigma-70 factor (ECF subfamily)
MTPRLELLPGGGCDRRETLRALYERHGASVRSRCGFILKDRAEAEDAMHEVFAKALERLDRFRAEASPHTWLMQIATHHCLNLLRSRRAGWREQVERMARLRPVESAVEPLEGRSLVRALLGRFDAETQAAAIHYWVDEMTLEEVAAALDRSVPTVRKRLAQFASAAREHLESLGEPVADASEASHG